MVGRHFDAICRSPGWQARASTAAQACGGDGDHTRGARRKRAGAYAGDDRLV